MEKPHHAPEYARAAPHDLLRAMAWHKPWEERARTGGPMPIKAIRRCALSTGAGRTAGARQELDCFKFVFRPSREPSLVTPDGAPGGARSNRSVGRAR